MQPNASPLEHLTAFAIAFAAGILIAASFVAFMEQARRQAIRNHDRRTGTDSNLSSPPSTSRR